MGTKKRELTNDDRYLIYKLLDVNTKQEIADIVGVHLATIYRELKRGRVDGRAV